MTERKSFEIQENREEIFARDGYICQVCGKSILQYGTPQLAHLIAQSQSNIKRYGKEVMHHQNNMKSVCSLYCNSLCNIGNRPVECEALVNKIKKAMEVGK